MSISKAEVSDEVKQALSTLLISGKHVLGVSPSDIISNYRKKNVVDGRRMMYNILRKKYKLTHEVIGALFNKDHSTVVYSERVHRSMLITEPEYVKRFDRLFRHFHGLKPPDSKLMTLMENQLLLKEMRSAPKETFRVILSAFNEHDEISDFISKNKVDRSRIVFCGYAQLMTEKLAHASVEMDEQKYLHSFMKKSNNINEILMNVYPDMCYKNYMTGKFDIMNRALESYMTAVAALGNLPIVLIHAQLQRRASPTPSAGPSTKSGVSPN